MTKEEVPEDAGNRAIEGLRMLNNKALKLLDDLKTYERDSV